MINGTYGVIWCKYNDEELLYTSYEREETEKKQNNVGLLVEHMESSGINIMTRGIITHQL